MRKLAPLLLAVFAGGCVNDPASVPPFSPVQSASIPTVPVQAADRLARFVNGRPNGTPERISREIGAAGGQLQLGHVRVIFPAGALDQAVEITISDRSKSEFADRLIIDLEPHGIEFALPVTVAFNTVATSAERTLSHIVWRNENEWQQLATTRNGAWIEANTTHFSTYGVASVGYCVLSPGEGDPDDYCRYPEPDECTGSGCLGIWTEGWSHSNCIAYNELWFVDDDGDQVDDWCESDLAYAFRPELQTMSDCNWDSGLNRQGGEYYWAAQRAPDDPSKIRIMYMPAYYRDCGSGAGSESWLAGPHVGDSEFIVMNLAFDDSSNHWYVTRIFLSAHCYEGSPWDDYCTHYAASGFLKVNNVPGGAPVVYVAALKHGNFRSASDCGHFDQCGSTGISYRFPAYRNKNVGSHRYPFINCGGPTSGTTKTNSKRIECIWSRPVGIAGSLYFEDGTYMYDYTFKGWQWENTKGSTPYGTLLWDKLETSW